MLERSKPCYIKARNSVMLYALSGINWLQIAVFLALGFTISWASIGYVLARSQASTIPARGRDFHHSHPTAIPRLGGIGLLAAFYAIVTAIFLTDHLSHHSIKILCVLIVGATATFALGFWDDLRPVRAHWKLAGQIAIATLVYFADIRIEVFKNPVTDANLALGIYSYFATVLWLVTLTNLINLIDGIDGLAGGISLMLMVLLANLGGNGPGIVMLMSVGLAGALLGFLKFNYPPARVYMGDSGAYFIGFLIGILSILNSHKGTLVAALIAPTFALALPLVDVCLAVIRRGLPGLPLFRPDRQHIHHHLIRIGFSRERAVLTLYGVSLICLLLAFSVFFWQGRWLPLIIGILFLVLFGAGHLSGYSQDWFSIGSRLGKSLALRKETRYALTLCRWLQMEAERESSIDALWRDFQFLAQRLGFSQVRLTMRNGVHTWKSDDFQDTPAGLHHGRHELDHNVVIEFSSSQKTMSLLLFDLLSDLAAETWYKSCLRWQTLHKIPMESLLSSGETEPAPGTHARATSPVQSTIPDTTGDAASLKTQSTLKKAETVCTA